MFDQIDIINNLPGYIHWKNKEGAFLGANNSTAKLLGFNSPADIEGLRYKDLKCPVSERADYYGHYTMTLYSKTLPHKA